MTPSKHDIPLMLAAAGAFLGGLLHLVALCGGPAWIASIGAPDYVVESARQGTWIAPVGALAITVLMWVCSAYALSGAGLLRPIPLLRTALGTIALLCLLRGMALIPFLLMQPRLITRLGTFDIVASLIWFTIGACFALGLRTVSRSSRAGVGPARASARPRAPDAGAISFAPAAVSAPLNGCLFWCGVGATLGALIHLAAIVGGPDWYAFIGAPDSIVEMVRAGRRYPAVVCLLIATILLSCAAYAFSGAGLIRRLPLLRTGLTLITGALLLRALGFIPLLLWRPQALVDLCDCKSVNPMVLVTSAICLVVGTGYGVGTRAAWSSH
jgi:hypothetical protein